MSHIHFHSVDPVYHTLLCKAVKMVEKYAKGIKTYGLVGLTKKLINLEDHKISLFLCLKLFNEGKGSIFFYFLVGL